MITPSGHEIPIDEIMANVTSFALSYCLLSIGEWLFSKQPPDQWVDTHFVHNAAEVGIAAAGVQWPPPIEIRCLAQVNPATVVSQEVYCLCSQADLKILEDIRKLEAEMLRGSDPPSDWRELSRAEVITSRNNNANSLKETPADLVAYYKAILGMRDAYYKAIPGVRDRVTLLRDVPKEDDNCLREERISKEEGDLHANAWTENSIPLPEKINRIHEESIRRQEAGRRVKGYPSEAWDDLVNIRRQEAGRRDPGRDVATRLRQGVICE